MTAFLQKLYDDGYIYAGEFEGFYCVGCEEYKQPSDLVPGTGAYEGQQVCAIHSIPVEVLSERNYFFRMSDFEQRLLDLYESNPQFIQPESVRNEIVSFVKQGLRDLSISRSSFDWGIQIPWDHDHVLYVWFDALLNYVTALGYGSDDDEAFRRLWPSVHIVGKDIARFHAVIWPAMLMAAGLPCRSASSARLAARRRREDVQVEADRHRAVGDHRHLRLGRVPLLLPPRDHLRAGRQLQLGGHLRPVLADLANGFGNLASRLVAMLQKYFDGAVPSRGELTPSDEAIDALAVSVTERADAAVEGFAPHEAIAAVWELVDALNGYITEQEPWALAKDETKRERLGTVLATALRGLGTVNVLVPGDAEGDREALGVDRRRRVGDRAARRPCLGVAGRRDRRAPRVRPVPAHRAAARGRSVTDAADGSHVRHVARGRPAARSAT